LKKRRLGRKGANPANKNRYKTGGKSGGHHVSPCRYEIIFEKRLSGKPGKIKQLLILNVPRMRNRKSSQSKQKKGKTRGKGRWESPRICCGVGSPTSSKAGGRRLAREAIPRRKRDTPVRNNRKQRGRGGRPSPEKERGPRVSGERRTGLLQKKK